MTMITLDEIDDELSHEPPRRRTIIDPYIPAGPILAFAPTGVGKTGFAVETATLIAGDLEWAGHAVQRGCVLYVAGENFYGVKERLLASCRFHGLRSRELPIGLLRPGAAGLVSPAVRKEIADAARSLEGLTKLPVSMIIVDTLGASFGPKSQDDAQFASDFMTHVEALSEEFSCAVLILHHTGKDGKMRGSQVFEDRADTVLKLDRQKSGEITAKITKQRSAPGGQRFAFDIGSYDLKIYHNTISVQVVEDLRHAAISDEAEEGQRQERESDVSVALRLLIEIAENGGASYQQWRGKMTVAWSDRSGEACRRAISTAVKKLTDEGRIKLDRQADIVSILVSENDAHNYAHTPGESVSVSVSATPPIRGGAHTRAAHTPHSKEDIPEPSIDRFQSRSRPKTGTEG